MNPKGKLWKCKADYAGTCHSIIIAKLFFLPKDTSNCLLAPSPNRLGAVKKNSQTWGACMAQSVEHPTLAQVTISQFLSLSPTSGSVLTAQSLEPASDSVSPPLSAPPMLTFHLLSLSLKNKY